MVSSARLRPVMSCEMPSSTFLSRHWPCKSFVSTIMRVPSLACNGMGQIMILPAIMPARSFCGFRPLFRRVEIKRGHPGQFCRVYPN